MPRPLDTTAISCQAHNDPDAHFHLDRLCAHGSKCYAFDDTSIPSELRTGAAYGTWRTDASNPSAGTDREHPTFQYTQHEANGRKKYVVRLFGTAVKGSGSFGVGDDLCYLPTQLRPHRSMKLVVCADSATSTHAHGCTIFIASDGRVEFERLLQDGNNDCNRVYLDGVVFCTDNTADTSVTF